MLIENESPEKDLESYVLDFHSNRVKELEFLESALKEGDLVELKSKAHAWKGFSRPYGFWQLEKLAIELEDAVASESIQDCEVILGKVSHYLSEKKKFI